MKAHLPLSLLLAAACATGHGEAATGVVAIDFHAVEGIPVPGLELGEARLVVEAIELVPGDEAGEATDDPHGHGHAHLAIRHMTDGAGVPTVVDLLAGSAAAPIETLAGAYGGLRLTLGADNGGCSLHLAGTLDLEEEELPLRICLPPPAVPIPVALPFDLAHDEQVEIGLHLELDRLIGTLPLASLARDEEGTVTIDLVENQGALALLSQAFATAFEGYLEAHEAAHGLPSP